MFLLFCFLLYSFDGRRRTITTTHAFVVVTTTGKPRPISRLPRTTATVSTTTRLASWTTTTTTKEEPTRTTASADTDSNTSEPVSVTNQDQRRDDETNDSTTSSLAVLRFEIDELFESDDDMTRVDDNDKSHPSHVVCHNFRHNPQVRNRLICPQGTVEEISLSHEQVQLLQQQYQVWQDENDAVVEDDMDDSPWQTGLRFTTGAVQFPGLTVDSVVVCGVRQIHHHSINDSWLPPAYQFVVLDVQNRASGARPMVWLFHKLTSTATPVTHSCTTVGFVPRHDGDDDNDSNTWVALRYHSRARVEFECSKRLLRFLPLSPERTQALGSQALRKAVQKEVRACIDACRPLLLSAATATAATTTTPSPPQEN